MDYMSYLYGKKNMGCDTGFNPVFMPEYLFDFQKHIVEWAIKKGRAAIFADCGMGKTPMQLTWAQNIVKKTNKPVLILTPLAVSIQTLSESRKFGIDSERSKDGNFKEKIVITNYESLHRFDRNKFAGVVCDESSILKSFDGARKNEITEFMRRVPYRLLCTATVAPNDYIELGTSSEALGYLGYMDMLNRFFKNTLNNIGTKRMYGESPKWRFKGHAELQFWRWVTSWAIAIRRPSDLGYSDKKFVLPKLIENYCIITPKSAPEGMLFNLPATTLPEQREEKKRTIQERCEKVSEMLSENQNLIWCQLNDEGKLLKKIIPDSVEISGSDNDDKKEDTFLGFARGEIKNLITKPKIGAWGMNWQNCNSIFYFPSHSYEQYYQSVRRCWRYGQKNNVTVNLVLSEGETRIMDNLKNKAKKAGKMFENLVNEMNNSKSISVISKFDKKEIVPQWL